MARTSSGARMGARIDAAVVPRQAGARRGLRARPLPARRSRRSARQVVGLDAGRGPRLAGVAARRPALARRAGRRARACRSATRTFDLVFCDGVLHHTPDPRGGVPARSRGVVKPGGALYVWLYPREGALREAVLRHGARGDHAASRPAPARCSCFAAGAAHRCRALLQRHALRSRDVGRVRAGRARLARAAAPEPPRRPRRCAGWARGGGARRRERLPVPVGRHRVEVPPKLRVRSRTDAASSWNVRQRSRRRPPDVAAAARGDAPAPRRASSRARERGASAGRPRAARSGRGRDAPHHHHVEERRRVGVRHLAREARVVAARARTRARARARASCGGARGRAPAARRSGLRRARGGAAPTPCGARHGGTHREPGDLRVGPPARQRRWNSRRAAHRTTPTARPPARASRNRSPRRIATAMSLGALGRPRGTA